MQTKSLFLELKVITDLKRTGIGVGVTEEPREEVWLWDLRIEDKIADLETFRLAERILRRKVDILEGVHSIIRSTDSYLLEVERPLEWFKTVYVESLLRLKEDFLQTTASEFLSKLGEFNQKQIVIAEFPPNDYKNWDTTQEETRELLHWFVRNKILKDMPDI